MKYFKLFEQFVTENNESVNEASISYSLKDNMDDMKSDKDYVKMLELIAKKMKTDPKNIAVISSEDDDYSDYQSKFKNAPFAAMNNPSSETKTYYSSKLNVAMSNDGSAMAYYVPADMLLENAINEASKFYTLEDMIDDNKSERDLQKAAAMCAVTLGLDPKEVAIVTTEDDVYDKYQSKYKNSKFAPFNNPSAEMSTAYAKGDNVITFNDGSVSGFFIPVESMNESVVNEAAVTAIDKKKMTSIAELVSDTDLFPELDEESLNPDSSVKRMQSTIDVIAELATVLGDDKDKFFDFVGKMRNKYGSDQVIWMNAENADQIEDSKLNSVFTELDEALSGLKYCFAEPLTQKEFVKAYNRLAKAVDKVLAATK